MKTMNQWLVIGIAVVTGLFSTVLSSLILRETPVAAQESKSEKVLKAERFELVDEKGKVRAQLGLASGGPVLLLMDENGKGRASLLVRGGSPALNLNDKDGNVAVKVGASDEGWGTLQIRKEGTKSHLMLWLQDDSPKASLTDKDGKEIWKAP